MASAPQTTGRSVCDAPDDAPPLAAQVQARCARCGKPARVRRMAGYVQGVAFQEDLCGPCYTAGKLTFLTARRTHLRIGTLIGLLGLLIGVLATVGEWFLPSAQMGFGSFQRAGVVIGALLVLIGALSRTDVIALLGTVCFAVALTADWVALHQADGIGWRQQAALGVAIALVAYAAWDRWGGYWRRKLKRSGSMALRT